MQNYSVKLEIVSMIQFSSAIHSTTVSFWKPHRNSSVARNTRVEMKHNKIVGIILKLRMYCPQLPFIWVHVQCYLYRTNVLYTYYIINI